MTVQAKVEISEEARDGGKVARVTIPGAAPGIYVFACDVFCGSHHEEMAGELIVE